MVDQELLFKATSDVPSVFVEKHELSELLCELAERSLPVTGVGVSLLVSDALTFTTALDESIVTIERAQHEARRGPCIDAHRDREQSRRCQHR